MSSTTHKVSTPAIPLTHAVYNGMVRALRTFINFLQEKMEPTLGRFLGIDIFLCVSVVCRKLPGRASSKSGDWNRVPGDVSLTGYDVTDRLLQPLGEVVRRQE